MKVEPQAATHLIERLLKPWHESLEDPDTAQQEVLDFQKEIKALRAEIAQLKTGFASTNTRKSQQEKKQGNTVDEKEKLKPAQKKKFNSFCYICGEDGHLRYDCEKEPNPALVQKKLLERSKKTKATLNSQGSRPSSQQGPSSKQ